ncbi:MAG: hypothetical protein QOJ61_4206 [Mycobacterium sp.]|nr:hypothetical protein [Mycobacterium sp.]
MRRRSNIDRAPKKDDCAWPLRHSRALTSALMSNEAGGFAEGRRQERRRYVERRAARTAIAGRKKTTRRPWTIEEAKTALDTSLTVPEAALTVGRTASAVESLRLRWRRGRLPDALAAHIPPPRRDQR